jgi:hypothetical protein
MIETVLVLPVFLVIVALVLYFGFAMVRVQQTQELARYESWRASADAPGPSLLPGVPSSVDANYASQPTLYSREVVFPGLGRVGNSAPDDAGLRETTYLPPEPAFRFAELVSQLNPSAAPLAEALSQGNGLPAGASVQATVIDVPDTPFAEQFAGPMYARFFRPDGDWRYVNNMIAPDYTRWYDTVTGEWIDLDGVVPPRRLVSISNTVRQVELDDLDRMLYQYLQRGDNPLLGTIDRFLSLPAAYLGPHIETSFDETPPADNEGTP